MEIIRKFYFFVNNYCNLNCELCCELCNIPFNKDSSWIERRRKWDVSLDEVRLFCERFKGMSNHKMVTLMGGEPTALPLTKLHAIINIMDDYHRKIELFTNGYNLFAIDKTHLNKCFKVTLVDHGINHAHIMRCKEYLKTFYEGNVRHKRVLYHYDLDTIRKLPINKGKRCQTTIMKSKVEIALQKGVVYPCFAMTSFEKLNNTTKLSEELINAGWFLKNPSLIETIRDFKHTLPDYVMDQCLNNCPCPNDSALPGEKITLKPHDVIEKTTSRACR